jgi:hypothetical protein
MRNSLHRYFAPLLFLSAVLAGRQPGRGATAAFWLNGIIYSNTSGLYGATTGEGLITWIYAAHQQMAGAVTNVTFSLTLSS